MTKPIQDRFRGLHFYYETKTDTYIIYILDKKTNNIKVSLKITDNKIQIVSGQLTQ